MIFIVYESFFKKKFILNIFTSIITCYDVTFGDGIVNFWISLSNFAFFYQKMLTLTKIVSIETFSEFSESFINA